MDSISSSILFPMCEKVMNTALEEYRLVRDVEEEIRNLSTTVSMIKGVLADAGKKQVENGAICDWLKSLKQVLYDAEDVLDEIATDEALGRRDADGTCRSVTGRLSKVRKLISCLCNVRHASTRHVIAHQIKDINKKLDGISRLKDRLGLRVPDENSWSGIRTIRRQQETSSLLPNEAHMIGRDDEKQKIEELLLGRVRGTEATSDNYKNVHVVGVVGMGGVGKTTLVKQAYNNPAVTEYFQLRMWVCVSNDFDLKRITREIMDSASMFEKTKEIDENSNWDVAQKCLQGKLEGKRFLLVLDDVWEEDPSKWENLCIPLMGGGKGSKILVTTRSQKVSNIIKGNPIILQDLSSEDLWAIFKRYAFEGQNADNHTQLALVGRQIVENLKGSPLAAKTIGRLLNANLDVRHWTNILKSKAWASPHYENSVLPILKLSYDHLPGHLKQCFAYCSLFPEDHEFDKNELVQLWTAQQFIRTREVSHLESVGGEYFDNLVYMSLFEKHTYYKEAYMMHDLIHDLAELVSEGDCLRLEDNQQKRIISETIRHVSIASESSDPIKIEELCKYENMRTLLFLHGCRFQLDPHLHNLFMKLQRLRVLGLSRCKIKKLPASIGTLKHLRLLDLSNNNLIGKLPESLCNLHNLQVLNLYRFGSLGALPRNMSALINLRHLIANDELVSGIEGVGKLTALHALCFDCGMQPMKELADMDMLRQLSIRSLEEVKSREEAIQSRLDKKEHLDELTLEWSFGKPDHLMNPGLDEEVLESLRPTSSIRRLTIKRYGGIRSPSWMEDQSWVFSSFLERLELEDCTNWEVLPPLGQLRCLTSLKISGMRQVRRIGPAFMGCCYAHEGGVVKVVLQGFPSLEKLKFRYMDEWEEWEVPHGNDGEVGQVAVPTPPRQHHPLFLARLRKFTIEDCPKLRQLPPLPPTLKKLKIGDVGLSELPGWLPSPLPSSSSTSLSSLEINDCPNLTSLAGGLLRHPLPKLVRLVIIDCRGLVSLPETALGHLTSLKELAVVECPKLAWPTLVPVEDILPPSLENITIREVCSEIMDHMMLAIAGCQKLTCLKIFDVLRGPPALRRSLPPSLEKLTIYKNDQLDDETSSAWLQSLSSLRSLSISVCPGITSLPLSHLTALENLEIRCLNALKSFGGGIHSLVSLEKVTIERCPELLDIIAADSSPSSSPLPSPPGRMGTTRIRTLEISGSSMQQMKTWLLQCPSLEDLSISACPQLTGFGGDDDGGDVGGELEAALVNLSRTLQHLCFWGCENLRSLPPKLMCLSSLKSLRIISCPQIRSLPVAGLPESLQSLEISGCPALEERCKEGGGSDWPLLSHITQLTRLIKQGISTRLLTGTS